MDEIETKVYLICYFDILGYKQLIDKIGENRFLHYIINIMKTLQENVDNNSYFAKYNIMLFG